MIRDVDSGETSRSSRETPSFVMTTWVRLHEEVEGCETRRSSRSSTRSREAARAWIPFSRTLVPNSQADHTDWQVKAAVREKAERSVSPVLHYREEEENATRGECKPGCPEETPTARPVVLPDLDRMKRDDPHNPLTYRALEAHDRPTDSVSLMSDSVMDLDLACMGMVRRSLD